MDGTGRSGNLRTLVAAAAMLVVPLLAMAPVFACGPTSTAHVAPGAGEPGTSATVSGSLFKATAGDVVIKWGGASGVVLATAPVAADGSFGPVPITVPADAERGRIAVLAVYQPADPSAKVSNVTFQVAGVPAAPSPAPQPVADSAPAAEAAAAPAATTAQSAPAAVAPAAVPAAAPRTRPAPTPAPAVAAPATTAVPAPEPVSPPAAVAAPAEAVPPLVLPEITETAPAGLRAPARSPQADAAASGGAARDGSPSPWVVVPLVALAGALLAVGIGVAYEPRRRRARAGSSRTPPPR